MRIMRSWRDPLYLATCLLVSAQGCVVTDDVTSSASGEDADASVSELDDKVNQADLINLETEELVRRVSLLPNKKVVVFDFDDTLYDHVSGQSSRWAQYAKSAISHLKARKINIAVCSRNQNTGGALNKRLRELDSQVFNDAFFNSPAFQDDTGVEKWDDIQQIMAHFGVKREDHVVFYDDTEDNIESVSSKSDVIAIPVEANGIDRDEFREGMIDLLVAASSGSSGGDTSSCKNQCSASCRCSEGQGDCDSNADCASGLVCPPDRDGAEVCSKPGTPGTDGGGTTSSGSGNLRVRVGSRWVSVGCGGSSPRADGSSDKWQIVDRKLRNQNGVYLFCDEGWAGGRNCECSRGNSEAYHAITQADFNVTSSARKYGNGLTTSLAARGSMYIFPNNGHEFCLAVGTNNVIQNKDGGDDGSHHESAHKGKCNEWCFGDGCP